MIEILLILYKINMDKVVKLFHQNNHPLFNIEINPDGWVLPSKSKFTKGWIEQTFKYKIDTREVAMCGQCTEDFCPIVNSINLFPYQKFVKDYMQFDSPYRGLLLYQGVGIGKSCTSIASAEILMNHMNVVIMTPASLRGNYIQEIKKCGKRFYQLNQYWRAIDADKIPNYEKENIYKLLKIHSSVKRIWFPDSRKESNYSTLPELSKSEITNQINNMINNSFDFINYNGLRMKRKKEINVSTVNKKNTYISDMTINGNPFDNKCVIVDEIHNLISRIINKGKVGIALYKLLMSAKNCKLILLSGTPIINYPYEIGYIINLLTGIQHIYYIKLGNLNIDVNDLLDKIPYVDTVEIDNINRQLKIKLLPTGFSYKDRKNLKVARYSGNILDNDDIIKIIKKYLKDYNVKQPIIHKEYKIFPEDEKEFNNLFLNEEKMQIENKKLFAKKVLGVVSYYSKYDKKLYPSIEVNEINIEMSARQFDLYEKARTKERKMERSSNLFASSSSVYRFYSRAYGNFVFPEGIIRPFPSNPFDEKVLDNEDDDKDDEYTKRIQNALNKIANSRENYLSYDNIQKLSPKMKAILIKLKEHKKSLIYTQFRKIEGVGILKIILEKNGWSEFKLKKENGEWVVHPESLNTKPKFMIFKGNGEDTQLLLKIYNMDKNNIPNSIKKQIDFDSGKNIIDIIFITISGSEGISLKEVRQVHILEPYWNYIRIDQVIGRAVRTCSHVGLPEDERNVSVYIYNIKYTKEQLESSFTIKTQDKGMTSDEYIYDVAKKKAKIINELLDLLKSASVDCSLNSKAHKIKCYSFPVNIEDDMDVKDIEDDDEFVDKKEFKAYILNTKKGNFIVNNETNEVFDYDIYIDSTKLIKIGKLKAIDGVRKIIKD